MIRLSLTTELAISRFYRYCEKVLRLTGMAIVVLCFVCVYVSMELLDKFIEELGL